MEPAHDTSSRSTESDQSQPLEMTAPLLPSTQPGKTETTNGASGSLYRQPEAGVDHARFPNQRWFTLAGTLLGIGLAYWWLAPWAIKSWNTISTDDAYVDGHVTFVAPRISGQVIRVLVDDNMRVKKGDLLVEIDPEPFKIQVDIKQALVDVAKSDLRAAHAQVEAYVGQARSARYMLQHAIENVENQIATLRSNVAQLRVAEATLNLAERDFVRNQSLLEKSVITQADYDSFQAKRDEARSRVDSASEIVQETRASLGLPINKENPLDIPEHLDQTFSLVKEALANLLQAVAPIGYVPKSWEMTPDEAVREFKKLDADGDIDRIYAQLVPEAPLIKQAEAKLMQAEQDLSMAQLNLRYCRIVSDIDGVVTRRNVNPGNFVQIGQSLMAVRSLTEIWVNANFKETQLANLRIGQRVEMDLDMYGSRQRFQGRITGFTMGTGQTLALLPPQNATGNFIKIVQRLPVRIELTDYDPEKSPVFVGLSVTPYVYYKEPAKGPNAGHILQPLLNPPMGAH